MVLAFAAAGADVVIASRKLDACEELPPPRCEATGPRRARPSPATSAAGATSRVSPTPPTPRSARSTCWSTTPACRPLTTTSPTSARSCSTRSLAVNLKGPFRLTAARRHAHGGGRRRLDHQHFQHRRAPAARPRSSPYAAAKAGAQRHDRGLRLRVRAEGPRQLHLARPFLTDSPRRGRGANATNPTAALKRSGQPEEIVPGRRPLSPRAIELHHRIAGPGRRRNCITTRSRGPNECNCCRRK